MKHQVIAGALAGALFWGAVSARANSVTDPGLLPASTTPTVPVASTAAPAQLTFSGLLLWVTALEGPHAELQTDAGARYALAVAPGIHLDLQAWSGRRATITGYPAQGATITQLPTILVTAIGGALNAPPPPGGSTAPVSPPGSSAPTDPEEALVPLPEPVPPRAPDATPPQWPPAGGMPGMGPNPGGPVTILPVPPGADPAGSAPAPREKVRIQPIPFHGTAFSLLFGRVSPAPAMSSSWLVGAVEVWDPSGKLGAHAGERVAVVARVTAGITQAVQVWPLQRDWSTLLQAEGVATLYSQPDEPIRVAIQGRILDLDSPPVLGNGRTLVPIRAIAEALGAEVIWDGTARAVTVKAKGRAVTMQVGANEVQVHLEGESGYSETLVLDIAPVIIRGRLLLPVRALSEALGWKVEWRPETRTVSISE